MDNYGNSEIEDSDTYIIEDDDSVTEVEFATVDKDNSDIKEYPCISIEGITLKEEILFISKKVCNTRYSLPLYFTFNNTCKKIGNFELTLNNLMCFKSIYNYKIWLEQDKNCRVLIDITNPEMMLNFIKL